MVFKKFWGVIQNKRIYFSYDFAGGRVTDDFFLFFHQSAIFKEEKMKVIIVNEPLISIR